MAIGNKIKKGLRWGNIWFSQFVARRMKNRRVSGENGKIVVIKIDAIGDFLIWLDCAGEFKKIYDSKNLTLICNAACGEIAESTGYFDNIIAVDARRLESDNKYRKRVCAGFADDAYDVLIQAAYSRTVHMDMLAMAVPAKEKIGMVPDESKTNLSRYMASESNRKFLDSIYDRLIRTREGSVMELIRNGEFIRGLGDEKFMVGIPALKEREVTDGIIPDENYYVVFPGASTPKKMWGIEGFAKIADYIYEKTGWTAYLCGSRSEANLYKEFVLNIKDTTKAVDYFGRTSLLELAEVIRHAKLVVSNDTSGIHFAAAVNTPSVCILGENNYGRFLPYVYEREYECPPAKMCVCHAGMSCIGCASGHITGECRNSMVTNGRYMCINNVTFDMVRDSVDSLL